MSTDKLSSDFILVLIGQCLLLCVALTTRRYWSTSIGRSSSGRTHIYATHWPNELSYVCQYHSKSMYGLSVIQSVSRLSVDRLMMLLLLV